MALAPTSKFNKRVIMIKATTDEMTDSTRVALLRICDAIVETVAEEKAVKKDPKAPRP